MTDVKIERETLQAALDAFQDIERMALIDQHHAAQLLMIGNRCTPIKDHLRAALAAQPAEPPAPAALTDEQIAGAVARGWCAPENAHKEMDADLALAITAEVRAVLAAAGDKP